LNQTVQIAPIATAPHLGSRWPVSLWQLSAIAILTIWIYAPILGKLVVQWWQDPNFSHGFFVPMFAIYVVWQERSRLSSIPARPSWTGLVIIAIALCTLIVGVLGAELFLSRVSLLILMAGFIVLFEGWNYQKALLFPWLFLFLMVPIPAIVFNQVTFPLQLLASKVASFALAGVGVPVLREGNVIQLPAMPLEVAEACSGIRSLLSLTTLSIIYGYLMEKRIAVRWMLAIASIPIAVAANALRIVGTGLLVQYWDPDKAEGFFHVFSGWLIFVISLLLLFALHRSALVIWPDRNRGQS
jgi:exosortase